MRAPRGVLECHQRQGLGQRRRRWGGPAIGRTSSLVGGVQAGSPANAGHAGWHHPVIARWRQGIECQAHLPRLDVRLYELLSVVGLMTEGRGTARSGQGNSDGALDLLVDPCERGDDHGVASSRTASWTRRRCRPHTGRLGASCGPGSRPRTRPWLIQRAVKPRPSVRAGRMSTRQGKSRQGKSGTRSESG